MLEKDHSRLFQAILILFIASMVFLAAAQSFGLRGLVGGYSSDLTEYKELIRSGEGYSMLVYMAAPFAAMGDTALSAALTVLLSVCNIASVLLLRKYLLLPLDDGSAKRKNLIGFLTVALFAVSMILPNINPRGQWYYGIGSPNPFHSPTYTLARPFSIIAFFTFISIRNNIVNKKKLKVGDIALFALSALLSCGAKPSFLLVFVPAAFFMCLADIIRSKFKLFVYFLAVAAALLPSGVLLYLQNVALYTNATEEGSVAFTLGKLWRGNAPYGSVLLAILFGLAFPLCAMLITSYKGRIGYRFKTAILMAAFGLAENYFLMETGARTKDANYFWGYQFAMFFLFAVAAAELFTDGEISIKAKKVAAVVFAAHLVCGLLYYGRMLFGASYM